jgi:TonB family protein
MVPPRLIEAPPIELPEGTEPLPDDAAVELVVVVAPDGTVSEVELGASLRADVDALALEAARGMRFEPATRDGVAIPARIRFRYRIAVPEPPPDPAADPGPDAPSAAGATGEATEPAPGSVDADTDTVTEPAAEPDAPPMFGARAEIDPPEAGAATRITLQAEELTTVPGTLGEPLRVVASLPGVVRSPFGLGFFVVRGANFQNTGFLIDGFPVPLLYHFGAGPAVIPSLMVERLHFYPGNYPLRYGRFSGGIVGVDTHVPDARSVRGDLSIDALRASGSLIVPFDEGRGAVMIGFRRSYYELLLPLFVDGLSLQYTDYQARIEYRWPSGFEASLFVLGSDDTLDQSGALGGGATTSAGTNTFIGINFQRVIARLGWRLGGGSTLRISGTVGRDGQEFGSNSVGQPSQRFAIETFNAAWRLDAAIEVAPWLTLNTGLDITGSATGVDVTAPAPTGLGEYPRPVFDPQLIHIRSVAARGAPGAYLEGILRFEPVEISLGVRGDLLRYGTTLQAALDPRIVARWRVIPEVMLKAGTGLFTQPPLAIQTIDAGGNPALGPERSWQSSVGTEVDLPLDMHVEVNGYYSQMFDVARFSQRIVPGADGQPRREFFRADGEGRAYGLELLIRRPVQDGFYFWLSYTLSRSERLNNAGAWVLFNQDQEHVLNLVASYYIDGWRFGGRFVLASGRPTTVISGGIYDSDADAFDAISTGEITRLPTYHQLDLRIDREWDAGPVHGTVYLEVLNVYNATNSEGVIYQYDFQRSTPLPGIPIIGTLGLQVRIE